MRHMIHGLPAAQEGRGRGGRHAFGDVHLGHVQLFSQLAAAMQHGMAVAAQAPTSMPLPGAWDGGLGARSVCAGFVCCCSNLA